MAAAYRSEQRRLLSFIRMSDFMMCDTLHTILVESVREVLNAVRPASCLAPGADEQYSRSNAAGLASSRPTLQTMSTLLNGSRRQRLSAAVAGMQLVPVTGVQQAGAGGNGNLTARMPIFELEILLSSSMDDLAFKPEPEQFQVGATSLVPCSFQIYQNIPHVTSLIMPQPAWNARILACAK